MDKRTVLEIITIIEAQLLHVVRKHNAKNLTDEAFLAASSELGNIRGHLQDYIEREINAVENSAIE